jgi:exodeoxyribonuclease-3
MKIATWNVNSVRARKDRLLSWLGRTQPDVACLQETKVCDDDFPVADVNALGYGVLLRGQSGYNGVAILVRHAIGEGVDPDCCFGDQLVDEEARMIATTVAGVRVICVYVPNGQAVGSDKYDSKIDWIGRLRQYLDRRADPEQPLILCGDFNVAPEDRDVHDPARWEGEIMCSPPERKALKRVTDWGLCDAFRHHHPEGGQYTWWDYRLQSFQRDRGLRIDHVYLSRSLLARCQSAQIERDERAGKNASDHAPVSIELT